MDEVVDESIQPEVVLLADMSDGRNPPIPLELSQPVFTRLVAILKQYGLMPLEVEAKVYAIGALFGNRNLPNTAKTTFQQEPPLQLSDEKKQVFSALVEQNYIDIRQYVMAILGGHIPEAEEITQEVFRRAYSSFGRFKSTGHPNAGRAWLYEIARNMGKNHFRDTHLHQQKVIMLPDDVDADLLPDPLQAVAHSVEGTEPTDASELLRKMVGAMENDDWMLTLYLKTYLDFTIAQTSFVMGKTEGAIKSMYHRILKYLKDKMDQKDE